MIFTFVYCLFKYWPISIIFANVELLLPTTLITDSSKPPQIAELEVGRNVKDGG